MSAHMPAKHGNWIHIFRFLCISMPEITRVAFLRRVFYFPGSIRMPASRAGDFDWSDECALSS